MSEDHSLFPSLEDTISRAIASFPTTTALVEPLTKMLDRVCRDAMALAIIQVRCRAEYEAWLKESGNALSGFCGYCGQPCEIEWSSEDTGIGHYEYWGFTGVHSETSVYGASACCDADVFDDAALTTPSTAEPPDSCDEPTGYDF